MNHRTLSIGASRRKAVAGLALGMLVAASPRAWAAKSESVTKLGLVLNRPDRALANAKALKKAMDNKVRHLFFPAGDCYIDNKPFANQDGVVIENFGGEVTMDAQARIRFTRNTTRGLVFNGGHGARFYSLYTDFVTRPTVRGNSMECILFIASTNTSLTQVRIDGSAGAGLLFHHCVNPSVTHAEVSHTMADGVHFANCQDGRADSILTTDTGDDGVAFVNYVNGPAYTGGLATNIVVEDSCARGIAVIGQSNVTVQRFVVESSAVSGLICAYDASYSTRVSSGVRFLNGSVRHGGAYHGERSTQGNLPQNGNTYGIEIHSAQSVEVSDVEVSMAGSRGVSCYQATPVVGGTVTLSDVRVSDVPLDGFNLQGTRPVSAADVGCEYILSNCATTRTGSQGFYFGQCGRVTYDTLSVTSASLVDPLRRAAHFDHSDTTWAGIVAGQSLRMIDTMATPTGYVVISTGTQTGTMGELRDEIVNGAPQVQNYSGLGYSLA